MSHGSGAREDSEAALLVRGEADVRHPPVTHVRLSKHARERAEQRLLPALRVHYRWTAGSEPYKLQEWLCEQMNQRRWAASPDSTRHTVAVPFGEGQLAQLVFSMPEPGRVVVITVVMVAKPTRTEKKQMRRQKRMSTEHRRAKRLYVEDGDE